MYSTSFAFFNSRPTIRANSKRSYSATLERTKPTMNVAHADFVRSTSRSERVGGGGALTVNRGIRKKERRSFRALRYKFLSILQTSFAGPEIRASIKMQLRKRSTSGRAFAFSFRRKMPRSSSPRIFHTSSISPFCFVHFFRVYLFSVARDARFGGESNCKEISRERAFGKFKCVSSREHTRRRARVNSVSVLSDLPLYPSVPPRLRVECERYLEKFSPSAKPYLSSLFAVSPAK